MTVEEMIEKLKEFDPKMNIGCGDSFYGDYCEIDGIEVKIESKGTADEHSWVRIYSSV